LINAYIIKKQFKDHLATIIQIHAIKKISFKSFDKFGVVAYKFVVEEICVPTKMQMRLLIRRKKWSTILLT
jgi:hypothetical protein